MRKPLLSALALLSLSAPVWAQPWLEVAEKYLPAVVEVDSRDAYRASLVHAYARNGEFARAQALIDGGSAEWKGDLGTMAAIGALKGGYVDQALRWAELYLPTTELAWNKPEDLTSGSDRERFLRSAPDPETAAKALEFLRAHGGVSPGSLAFVCREVGGMPMAVSDFYLREFSKVGASARPIDWVQIEESAEASGPEFADLEKGVLEVLLTKRPQLVEELGATTDATPEQLESGMKKYTATLLARQGRFDEAEEMWKSAGPADVDEQKLYLQNQYLGGRKAEAMGALIKQAGMEEDAKVQLSLFLLGLGHLEEMKALRTDPVEYIDKRIADRDLQRSLNVDKWLAFAADLDARTEHGESLLWKIGHDPAVPRTVREQALARLTDAASVEKSLQSNLQTSLEEVMAEESGRVTLMLLILDDDIKEAGCTPGAEGLEVLEKLRRTAPIVTEEKGE